MALGASNIRVLLFYMKGMIDEKLLVQSIVKPIMDIRTAEVDKSKNSIDYIKKEVITSGEIQEATKFDLITYELLSGNTIIFVDGCKTSLIIGTKGIKERNVEKPDTEQTIRGNKQSFVENIYTNIALIRNMIKSPDLTVDFVKVGKRSKTNIGVIYLRGVINEDLPQSIIKSLGEINIDGIVDSSQIQALIQKHKWTIFTQMVATERVDRITSAILEGRAGIIVEGSPFVLIVPTTFGLFLNTPDDYYERFIVTSLLRIIRYAGFFGACSTSALYLALTTYHPGMIPTPLALSIAGTRVGLPFPVTLEIVIMELALYLIQEAALRLPKVVGQTVGIVGGLVIGQSVVQAGIVSPIIVIIVSLTAIASFALPVYTFALSTIVIRLFLILSSMVLGLYGFAMGWIFLLIHLSSLESFGVKYMADYSHYSKGTIKDALMVAPTHTTYKRPEYLDTEDDKKADFDRKADTNE